MFTIGELQILVIMDIHGEYRYYDSYEFMCMFFDKAEKLGIVTTRKGDRLRGNFAELTTKGHEFLNAFRWAFEDK